MRATKRGAKWARNPETMDLEVRFTAEVEVSIDIDRLAQIVANECAGNRTGRSVRFDGCIKGRRLEVTK